MYTTTSSPTGTTSCPFAERFGRRLPRGFADEAAFDRTESWCTILQATCGRHATWAMGFGQAPGEASISALLNAATLLHLR